MSDLRQAAQAVIDRWDSPLWKNGSTADAIADLRTALEQEAEPVEPKCGAIIEVFGKDWRLEYLSLPVGKHKLYVQQYTYTPPPPQRKPLTIAEVEQILAQHNYEVHGDRARYIVRMTEEAHGIKEGS